ncbi:MAG: SRPBCC domain-containing protein [Ignavibacteriae bacterium]|nr:SRPBCC domain-containing protein [Ignavibacteriota bacterium]
MAKEISTEILINASPEKVWLVFTDFSNYPQWNPFIKSVAGEVSIGNTIAVLLEPPGGKGMTFKPKVLAYEKNKEFRWIGNLLFPGLFDGEHKFELINNGDGTTTFRQSEKFKGILVPLFNKMLDTTTKDAFNLMNLKLKELVERK